jgi:hypothetical protein
MFYPAIAEEFGSIDLKGGMLQTNKIKSDSKDAICPSSS